MSFMEKGKKYFSIIIPVYNCSKYLSKCIDSVISQTYQYFELILVDDGSTDGSEKICDEYLKKDKRIKLIHKKNSGVSDTRNQGLKMATGDYIAFLDSDDYVDNTWLENSIKHFSDNPNLELLNYGFYSEVEYNNQNSYNKIIYEDKLYNNKSEINKDIVNLWDKHMLYNIWNKIYLNKIIKKNKIQFPDFNFGEDMHFNIEYLKYVNKFYNSTQCFYHYIKERKGSITNKYNEQLFSIRIKEYNTFNEYFENLGLEKDDYIEFSSRRFIERVLGCIENICASNLKISLKLKKIKTIIKNETTIETLKFNKSKSKKMKILLIPIKIKSTILTFLMVSIISVIRNLNPALFNNLKNKR